MNIIASFTTEALKLKRSKLPLFVLSAFSLAPLAIAFLMLILKDPEGAKKLGLIAMKAQMTGGSADWPFLLYVTKAVFVAAAIFHAVLVAYVFGREYAEGTAKNMLTLPVRRPLVVVSKYALVTAIFLVIASIVLAECMAVGFALRLPGWDSVLALQTARCVALSTLLITMAGPFVALAAMAGKGYIAPIGYALLSTILVGQLFSHTLWGYYIPWSMLFINAGAAAPDARALGPESYAIASIFFITGMLCCGRYLERADNHQ